MILYILVYLFTVVFAFFIVKPQREMVGDGQCLTHTVQLSKQKLINGIVFAFLFTVMFAVSALRYETGNDYSRYEEFFRLIRGGWYVPTEWGFNKLILGMEYLFGDEAYIAFFAVFAFVTVFIMLKALYRLSDNFGYSFLAFMSFGLFFQSMNTMRYYLALSIAFYALSFVHTKEYAKFVLSVVLAALIHKSVLIVIPVFLVANLNWKLVPTIILTVFSSTGLFLGSFYQRIILFIYPSYKNTDFLEGGTSIINIARCLIVLGLCLVYWKEKWREDKALMLYFRLNYAALLLYSFGSFIPEVSRIGTYLTITHVLLIPGVVLSLPKGRKRTITSVMCVLFFVLYFAAFIYKAYGDLVKLLPYHTWVLQL